MKASRSRSFISVLILFMLSALTTGCLKSTPDDTFPRLALDTTSFTLANGLRIVIHEDHRVPKVKVSIKAGVGSADEPPGRGGFAHLFEHLMFMGTKDAPNFDDVMERVGGENNAYTDFDETVFYETAPSNALPTLLWLEADRLSNLASYMTEAKVNLQRDVVLNEMNQNVLDTPGAGADEAGNEAVFPKGHPYVRPVIGSIADLKAAKVDDVVDFFMRYYGPSNLTMIITGDVDTTKTQAMANKLFSGIPDRKAPKIPSFPITLRCSPCNARQEFVDAVANPRINFMWNVRTKRKDGSIANPDLELAAIMLNDSYANALQQHLVRNKQLASNVSVSYDPKELAGFFSVTAETIPGGDAKVLEAELNNELRSIAKDGFAATELNQAKIRAQTSLYESFEESGGRADLLQLILSRYRSPNRFNDFQHRFVGSSLDSIRSSFADMITTAPKVTQVVKPGSRGDYPAVLTRSSGEARNEKQKAGSPAHILRPPNYPPRKIVVPDPTRTNLDNGIPLVYFQRADAPRTRIVLSVRGGSTRDPVKREGRAAFISELMTKGAGTRSTEVLTKDLALLGADVSVSGDQNEYTVRMNSPAVNTPQALSVLADVIEHPLFNEKEFKLLRSQTLAQIEQVKTDAAGLAARAGTRIYTGSDSRSRYATSDSVKALDLKDMRAEHQKVFQPQNARIVASGTAPIETVAGQLNAAMSGWKNVGVAIAPVPKLNLDDTAGGCESAKPTGRPMCTYLIDVPNASQSTLLYRATGPKIADPNNLAAQTSSIILGGTFSSRLNRRLREEKGYTYGASAQFGSDNDFGLTTSSADVETSVTGPALKEMLNVIQQFSTGDLNKRESETAAATVYAGSIGLVSTSSGLIETFAGRTAQSLSWKDLAIEINEQSKYSIADLNRGATHLQDGRRTIVVIAGDLAKVRPQLKGLELGQVTEVTPKV